MADLKGRLRWILTVGDVSASDFLKALDQQRPDLMAEIRKWNARPRTHKPILKRGWWWEVGPVDAPSRANVGVRFLDVVSPGDGGPGSSPVQFIVEVETRFEGAFRATFMLIPENLTLEAWRDPRESTG